MDIIFKKTRVIYNAKERSYVVQYRDDYGIWHHHAFFTVDSCGGDEEIAKNLAIERAQILLGNKVVWES